MNPFLFGGPGGSPILPSPTPPLRPVAVRPGIAVVLLAVAAAVGLSCKREAAAPPGPPSVEVMEVVGTNLPLAHEIIGQLDSPENVQVRARVEGFVEKVLFTEGTNVNAGDPLFLLDRKPFLERLAAAQGQLAQAEATLNKYRKDVERLEPLARKKAIPRQDLENAQASVAVGEAAVQSAKAGVESAQLNLEYCDVRAPIAGRIGAREVVVGDLVGKGEPTLLATISRVDPIWFYCGVSEVQYLRTEAAVATLGRQVADLPVALILADGRTMPERGRFVFVDRVVDAKTGTLRLRAEFANREGLLRPGMFARIRIDLGTRADAVVVPERAVTELQGRDFVWVVGGDRKAAQRKVTRSKTALVEGGVVIEEGLKAGERIVVEGVQKVRDGLEVQPKTAAERAGERAAADAAAAQAATSGGHGGQQPAGKE
jgi:membrane fusion protein (multidrug efflux system)